MAGLGKRMRPHTLTSPKPLINIAGKPIVQHLIEEIATFTNNNINEIAFIVGNWGNKFENDLIKIAENVNAKGKIYYQTQPLGTAHALLCAKDSFNGPILIAFADTLFYSKPVNLNNDFDGFIWVQKVKNPKDFGVVKINENEIITEFIEKPDTPISNLAIIGIYYFTNSFQLKTELQNLVNNNIIKSGEFQLTDALQNMLKKQARFKVNYVDEWLDCGNKNATLYAHKKILEKNKKELINDISITNSLIIKPCFIDKNVTINNSVIGPYVSIGNNSIIQNSIIQNSIIQSNTIINDANIENSMIGNFSKITGKKLELNLGDFCELS